MTDLHRPRHLLGLGLVALLTCAPAAAQTPASAETAWSCWYAGGQQVACVVGSAPAAPAPAAIAVAAKALDPRLPPQVRSMRLTPAAWRHKTVFIPLWDEPFDTAGVAQLAQSVMCGASPQCRVSYQAEAPLEAPQFAALLADVNDPLLAD